MHRCVSPGHLQHSACTHTHARACSCAHTHWGQQPMHIHKPQQWREGAPADGWWVRPENQPKAASWGQTQTRFSPLRESKGEAVGTWLDVAG